MATTLRRAPVANPAPARPASFPPKRPLSVRIGKKLRRKVDALIGRSSFVSNAPVLDAQDFAWTRILRDNWQMILDEARAVLEHPEAVPLLDEVSPDHKRIAPAGKWRSFFLRGYGCDIAENMARCPRTTALVRQIPGLNSAFFSILAPGAHIPPHRGVTKGLVTCHLGLIVPHGNVRMRVDREIVPWAEGETLLFDDTYEHEVWNDTEETRVVLLIQFARPLRAPGKWLADLFLWGVKHTAFVREARDNVALWARNMRRVEDPHGLDKV
jgi:aspartyl/asparaginyl beta-hydroxylase (cupin superfamily)